MRIVLFGPPGVGKGTQGRRLAGDRGWTLISTGEALRDAVSRGTPIGQQAAALIATGQLVPDDVIIGLVRERATASDAEPGFVLDGFPRTIPQAEALDELLAERGLAVDAVLAISAPEEDLVRRLSSRRECPVCKRAYNLVSVPPRVAGQCDDHPETLLVQRDDDNEETIRRRLEIYHAQTRPLAGFYRESGRLIDVQGTGDADEVYDRLKQALVAVVGER